MNQREIKFRAWDKKNKRTVYHFPIAKTKYSFNRYIQELQKYPLMQFTGLKDKNGKEIYEGDIVKTQSPKQNSYQVKLVEWDSEIIGWGIWRIYQEFYEIIGNIYENPELLK